MRSWSCLVGILAALASPAAAGTLCRSISIAGHEAPQSRAKLFLAAATTRTDAIELYVEKVARGYYYESNHVADGAEYTTKIFSETPMAIRSVVENMLFPTRAEADANADLVTRIMQRHLVVHVEARLADPRTSPIRDISVSRVALIASPLQYASAE